MLLGQVPFDLFAKLMSLLFMASIGAAVLGVCLSRLLFGFVEEVLDDIEEKRRIKNSASYRARKLAEAQRVKRIAELRIERFSDPA